jgi:L-2-hydroxyglutarate oxidase LhgO
MQEFDYVVIGGGIVGLAVAWTILERKPATASLEIGRVIAEQIPEFRGETLL